MSNNQTILIIEDDPSLQELYKISLSRGGYNPIVRGDAISGLKWLEQILPDLVLLDIMLPGLSGVEMLEKLRKTPNGRNVPVMVATADSTINEQDFVAYHIAKFFHKPLLPRELIATVDEFFDSIQPPD